jgi:hydroxymethylglutaryl-CoA lyase
MAGMVPGPVQIVEVAPRDGLQAEDVVLPTATKVELIRRVVGAGATRVEVCSFVNPARVPQMADAEAVLDTLGPPPAGVTYIGLVLNRRGFERAAEAGLEEINIVAAATDTFAERNQGTTSNGSLEVFEEIAPLAVDAGIRPTLTISTSFGCPYEGEVPVKRVLDMSARAVAAGAAEIAVADTIGVAAPPDVREVLDGVSEVIAESGELVYTRAHFHNTRNTGLANAWAAVEAGVNVLDASLGGIGGCPFAPGATGNIPTEDLAYLLERSGVASGFHLGDLVEIVPWIEDQLGKRVPGLLSKAGLFPK